MQSNATQRKVRHFSFGLALSLITLLIFAALSVTRAQAQEPIADDESDAPVEGGVVIVNPVEGQVVALNGGGPENAFPVTWGRVDGALFYHIEIYSPEVLLKDGDLVLEEASKLDYIYNPDDHSTGFLLQDPVFNLDVGQLEPGLWHQIVITAYGPTERFLQDFPDFRNQPTDLGIDSGYYVALGAPSLPRSFFLAVATGDAAVPATPPLEDFPTYDEILEAAPAPELLPTLEETPAATPSLFDIINSIRFGNSE